MARVTLEFDDAAFCFTTELTVRSTDINAANHLGNDAMISMLSEARSRFLHHFDINETGNGDGAGIIVTDLATVYQSESHYPDRLRFEVGITDFNRYGGDFIFRVTRQPGGDSVALAKYGFVFYDYRKRCVVPVPETFRNRFAVQ